MRTLVPGSNTAVCPPSTSFLADQAAIQADVFQLQLAVVQRAHGMLPRDQRALQADACCAASRPMRDLGCRSPRPRCGGFR